MNKFEDTDNYYVVTEVSKSIDKVMSSPDVGIVLNSKGGTRMVNQKAYHQR